MPVPTDTYWNMKRLNVIFAASAVALFLSSLALVMVDWSRPWRAYQQNGLAWEVAMTEDAQAVALTAEDQRELNQLKEDLERLRASIDATTLNAIQARKQEAETEIEKLKIRTAVVKGQVGPKKGQIERAVLEHGRDSAEVRQLQSELADINVELTELESTIAGHQAVIDEAEAQLDRMRAEVETTNKQIAAYERRIRTLEDKLKQIAPQGLNWVGQQMRNAPLLDWFNPSEKTHTVFVPDIRAERNFLTVDTADRCHTCHVNIDDRRFEPKNLIAFTARQIALAEGQDVNYLPGDPVVMLDWWHDTLALAGLGDSKQYEAIRRKTLERLKVARDTTKVAKVQDPLGKMTGRQMEAEFNDLLKRITKYQQSQFQGPTQAQTIELTVWYEPVAWYFDDLRKLIRKEVGDKDFKRLMELYRRALIKRYNEFRDERGLPELSDNPVLMGHPNMDLYANSDSKHPIKLMGCTSCHEGSGEETDFEHTAHTPRDVWVDRKTGVTIPSFLLKEIDHDDAHDEGDAKWVHKGVKITDPDHPDPYSPEHETEGEVRQYIDPGATDKDATPAVVKQATYWTKEYGWAHVHYMHWEKPMNRLDFIESSCAKCHTQVYDVKDTAPTLYEGRRLYAELGCINCHSATEYNNAPDVKQVGPSLVHVKHKLSSDMMASWIWSPKAFRPMTKMPHYFMQENNSSPRDILRTRTEVAAMTHYLLNAEPDGNYYFEQGKDTPRYTPEFPPDVAALRRQMTDIRSNEAKLEQISKELEDQRQQITKLNEDMAEVEEDAKKKQLQATIDKLEKGLLSLTARKSELEGKAKDTSFDDQLKAIQTQLDELAKQELAAVPGDVEAGRKLFNELGCLACHTNMDEHGKQWIVDDLQERRGMTQAEAEEHYSTAPELATYNKRHWYAMEHFPEKLEKTGPELSGIGSKLLAGRNALEARAWLYDWLRNPRQYHSNTIMPSFRLSPEEAIDMTKYLLSLQRPGFRKTKDGKLVETTKDKNGKSVTVPYAPADFSIKGDKVRMLDAIVEELGLNSDVTQMARQRAKAAMGITKPDRELNDAEQQRITRAMDRYLPDSKQYLTGKKMIQYYGCNGCHQINGFETAISACTSLDEWGLKDPHKLDFGYFEHSFERLRRQPAKVWQVEHDGLSADGIAVNHKADKATKTIAAKWEHIEGERRPWLYHKLHNTRIYDRGRFPGHDDVPDRGSIELERPYDKLKMPRFYMTDAQAHALTTFVTSIRKPLVTAKMQQVQDEAGERATRGRMIATKFNCYGCHNIEGNDPHMWRFIDVADKHGNFNWDDPKALEKMHNGAPHLIGQGAKTNPDWLTKFLQDVHELRPWVNLRMPSYPITGEEATGIADYFAGATQEYANRLATKIQPIELQVKLAILEDLQERVGLTQGQAAQQFARMSPLDRDIYMQRYLYNDEWLEREGPKRLAKLRQPKYLEGQVAATMSPAERDAAALKGAVADWKKMSDAQKAEFAARHLGNKIWYHNPGLDQARQTIAHFGNAMKLASPASINRRAAKPGQFDPATYRQNWLKLYKETRFLQDLYDIEYPFPGTKWQLSIDPQRNPEAFHDRYLRGEALFRQLNCVQCHVQGDPQKILAIHKKLNPDVPEKKADEGDPFGGGEDAFDEGGDATADASGNEGARDTGDGQTEKKNEPKVYPAVTMHEKLRRTFGEIWSAPNMIDSPRRLQARWVRKWLQASPTISPGTKMPTQIAVRDDANNLVEWGSSPFKYLPDIPDESNPGGMSAKALLHAKYGWTGDAQVDLLMDYVHASSLRYRTYNVELLEGKTLADLQFEWVPEGTETKGRQLTLLPKPKVEVDKAELLMAKAGAKDGGNDAAAVPDTPLARADKSVIKLQEGDVVDYEGDTVHGSKTRLVGTVFLDGTVLDDTGKPYRRQPIMMSSDQNCAAHHTDAAPLTEDLIVNKDKSVQNVVIHVIKGLPAKQWEAPKQPAVLDQVGCQYLPHILAMQAGQQLLVRNSDNTAHNVRFGSQQNGSGNYSQPVKGSKNTVQMKRPEDGITFQCDVHPWMNAQVFVIDHPFFAVSDVEGRFEIKGLPPGTYTLEAIQEHSKVPPVRFEVTIGEGKSHLKNVTLKPNNQLGRANNTDDARQARRTASSRLLRIMPRPIDKEVSNETPAKQANNGDGHACPSCRTDG